MFFYQAEDGIRYLVRSRGLGDVYKRQGLFEGLSRPERLKAIGLHLNHALHAKTEGLLTLLLMMKQDSIPGPVSYTHLTLPTSDLVEISVVAVSLKKTKESRYAAERSHYKKRYNSK